MKEWLPIEKLNPKEIIIVYKETLLDYLIKTSIHSAIIRVAKVMENLGYLFLKLLIACWTGTLIKQDLRSNDSTSYFKRESWLILLTKSNTLLTTWVLLKVEWYRVRKGKWSSLGIPATTIEKIDWSLKFDLWFLM